MLAGTHFGTGLAACCYSIIAVQPQPNSSPLATHCEGQDRRFRQAFELLEDAVRQQAFPGAALAVGYRGNLVAHKAVGRFTYEPSSPEVKPDTVYDLASVTKVVATTAVAMLLFERGILDLEMPLVQVLPEFATNDLRRIRVTLRSLLAHSSGLPGYARLFETAQGREAVLRAASSLPLACDPGAHAEYSDIGFLLLGEALERLAGEPLNQLCGREIFTPLGMAHTCFLPPPEWHDHIPPTENDRVFRGRIVQGEVQDENAAAMGGVAGHAGVFAPALEVAVFAECMLHRGAPILSPQTVERFTLRQAFPPGTSRALGWDTPSRPSQSGRYFSPGSFGHLGYAGTSLWIDPERRLSVTLLTNRTWPDRKSQLIKPVRPAFHDAILEALEP
jgi:CubicO group peptidase (beta-lactamase class C family)